MNLDLREIPAVYINLDRDVEKKEKIESSLKELGFKNIIRLSGVEHDDGKVGCAISHALAMEEVEPPFIVFEDDCVPLNFEPIIEIPDDADAVYLGISSWGRMNSHSGPFVQWKRIDDKLLQVYNMLGAHAILYINEDFVDLYKRVAYNGYLIEDYHDIGFAEVQKYYDVYAFDNPMFYQTSSNGTNQPLSTYPSLEIYNYDSRFWLPLEVIR